IAAASAVLLKNNPSTLPLSAPALKGRRVTNALIPNLNCGDSNECDDGPMTIGWGSGSNSLLFTVPPITALNQTLTAAGAILATSLTNDLEGGDRSGCAIVLVNAMSGELGFYQFVNGNEGDRNDLELWFSGSTLVQNVAAVCNNTIVEVYSVGP
ncbi:hypothetical protein C8R46DRAFT_859461, partial [Mycena filopes]